MINIIFICILIVISIGLYLREKTWRRYVALLGMNINDMAGLYLIRGITQTCSDEVVEEGKRLRHLLGITNFNDEKSRQALIKDGIK